MFCYSFNFNYSLNSVKLLNSEYLFKHILVVLAELNEFKIRDSNSIKLLNSEYFFKHILIALAELKEFKIRDSNFTEKYIRIKKRENIS